jgi:hypothetical protein
MANLKIHLIGSLLNKRFMLVDLKLILVNQFSPYLKEIISRWIVWINSKMEASSER